MATTSHAVSSHSESHGFFVGLTGGIGSGKTAAADLFGALGAAIVDSDALAHALTAPNGGAIGEIAQVFGSEYIGVDGALDRKRMRETVFRDPLAKARLEKILHPRIRELARTAAAAAAQSAPYVIFVVPLLVESHVWRDQVDRLLVIDCSLAAQEARVQARSGLDHAMVRRIIEQQASRTDRLDAADDVLVNEAQIEQLAPRVRRLHDSYCQGARGRVNRV